MLASFRLAPTALGIVTVAVFGATPPMAAQQTVPRAEPAQRTIRVTGVGEQRVAPDEARIELAVETQAPTARAAGDQNARAMERVITALVRAGVPRGEIETRGYSVYPDYRDPRPGDTVPQIRSYRAANTVSARTEQLDRVGALIDVALGAGANRLNGIMFGLRNDAAPRAAALRNAVAQARRDAETMASALGVQLGSILDASTASAPAAPYPMPVAYRMAADMETAQSVRTPIQPGEQTVTATASLVFGIQGGR